LGGNGMNIILGLIIWDYSNTHYLDW